MAISFYSLLSTAGRHLELHISDDIIAFHFYHARPSVHINMYTHVTYIHTHIHGWLSKLWSLFGYRCRIIIGHPNHFRAVQVALTQQVSDRALTSLNIQGQARVTRLFLGCRVFYGGFINLINSP